MNFLFHAHARLMKLWNTGEIPRLQIFLKFFDFCSLHILILILFLETSHWTRETEIQPLSSNHKTLRF